MDNVWKIDLVLIMITLLVMIVLVGYAQPLVIAPFDDYESLDSEVLFEFERADVLLIDDNMDFTTPREYNVVDGERIELIPGVYYWKVVGVMGSEVRKLTINSVVNLELVETEDGFGVVNAGNVRLNVEVYDGEELIDKKKLDVGNVVEGGDKFVGSQDG